MAIALNWSRSSNMPAGRFDGSMLRLAMISSLSGPGMRGLILRGGTSFRSSPGLRIALLSEPSGEHAVHRGAEVVNVRLLVDHLFRRLFGREVLGRSLDPVLVLTADPGGAEVDQLHLAVLGQHDVAGLQVAVVDPAAVHVRHRRGDLAEHEHELPQLRRLDLVERLALDVFQQQLDPLDLEPRLLEPAIVHLGDRRMVQLLGRFEFGQGLLDVNFVLGLLLADHLEGILLAASRFITDQKDRAPRARRRAC